MMKQQIPLKVSKCISDRGWDGCMQVWVLDEMFQKINDLIEANPISEDYRMDMKQAYKITVWYNKICE